MLKLRLGALLVTAMFLIYGAKEIVAAVKHGGSTSDGLEALAIGAVVFASYLILTKIHHRAHPEDFDAR